MVISFISIKLVFVSIFAALQKAGKHMEDSVVAAYVALLLGCILQENEVSIKSGLYLKAVYGCIRGAGGFQLLFNINIKKQSENLVPE